MKYLRKFPILTLAIAFAFGLLLSACTAPAAAPSDSETTSDTEAVAEEEAPAEDETPVVDEFPTIRLAWFGSDLEKIQDSIEEVNRSTDYYEIELVHLGNWSDFREKIIVVMAGGGSLGDYDLIRLSPGLAQEFVQLDILLNLDDIEGYTDIDLGDYIPAALEAYTYDSSLYGLPWAVDPLMLYVNTEILEACGLYQSETWGEFWEVRAALDDCELNDDFKAYYPEDWADYLHEGPWTGINWLKAGIAAMTTHYASEDIEGFEDSIQAMPMPRAEDGTQYTAAYMPGIGVINKDDEQELPEMTAQALINLTDALQLSSGRPAAHANFFEESIAGSPHQESIKESMEYIGGPMGNTVWIPYLTPPAYEEIGDATLVPGAPPMLLGVNYLSGVTDRPINVARTVFYDGTYLAPHFVSDDDLNRHIAVGANEDGPSNTARALKVEDSISWVGQSGDEPFEVDEVEFGEEDHPEERFGPTAGIFEGSKWCRVWDSISWILVPCLN